MSFGTGLLIVPSVWSKTHEEAALLSPRLWTAETVDVFKMRLKTHLLFGSLYLI